MGKKFEPKKLAVPATYEESIGISSAVSIKKENADYAISSIRIRADFKRELDVYAAMNDYRGFGSVINEILHRFSNPATGLFDRDKLDNFLTDKP